METSTSSAIAFHLYQVVIIDADRARRLQGAVGTMRWRLSRATRDALESRYAYDSIAWRADQSPEAVQAALDGGRWDRTPYARRLIRAAIRAAR